MGVLGYSVTPGSNNNALAGVGSLAENVMPIKQINDAMRQQVADIAQLYSDVVTGIYTTGTSSAYLAATASGHTVYNNTMALRLRFHVDSAAGAVTVNVNGIGTKSLKIFATTGSRDPVAGEIKADMAYDCVYIAALNCMVVTDPVVPAVDLSSRQPIDADLTAIAGLATTGLINRTGSGTAATVANGTADQELRMVAGVPTWTTVLYESAEQTITVSAVLTLTHGLGSRPKNVFVEAICKTAEHGYVIGDIVPMSVNFETSTQDYGVSIRLTTTSILIKYGPQGTTLAALSIATGASVALTNANWRLIVRAMI